METVSVRYLFFNHPESMNKEEKLPEWHPERNPKYDQTMTEKSAEVLDWLQVCNSSDRLTFLRDTRRVHKKLYESLTPSGYPEYAGTYRGAIGTSLESRPAAARRLSSEGLTDFQIAHKVSTDIEAFAALPEQLFARETHQRKETLLSDITKIFYFFGQIHPYLDGNGHIQRLMFAACVIERPELSLRPEWTIHPRAYKEEFALCFEREKLNDRLSCLMKFLDMYIDYNLTK
jgi:fido (protein-threonine AMPylation protein)